MMEKHLAEYELIDDGDNEKYRRQDNEGGEANDHVKGALKESSPAGEGCLIDRHDGDFSHEQLELD